MKLQTDTGSALLQLVTIQRRSSFSNVIKQSPMQCNQNCTMTWNKNTWKQNRSDESALLTKSKNFHRTNSLRFFFSLSLFLISKICWLLIFYIFIYLFFCTDTQSFGLFGKQHLEIYWTMRHVNPENKSNWKITCSILMILPISMSSDKRHTATLH